MKSQIRTLALILIGFVGGVAFLISCRDDDRSGGAPAAAQSAGLAAKIHVSTTTGPVTLAAGNSKVIRTVTFTASAANDVPIYFIAQGTCTFVTTNDPSARLRLRVAQPGLLEFGNGSVFLDSPTSGTFVAFAPLQTGRAGASATFPAGAYSLTVSVDNSAGLAGGVDDIRIDTLQLKVVTLEGLAVDDPSPNFN